MNRLDSIRTAAPIYFKQFNYETNGWFKGFGYVDDGVHFTYNSDGLVTKMVMVSYAIPIPPSTIINIHYQNGTPVSGRLRYYPYQNKVAHPYYETDSILYKVTNGKVTEIKHIDHAVYYQLFNQLVQFVPGTKSIHTLTYQGNNLTKIETANASFAKVMTYGTKKGIHSAYPLKFVLYEKDDPAFTAENDLTSIIEPFTDVQTPTWRKVSYNHQYNPAGFPKSSVVSVTNASGQLTNTYDMKYFYK